MKKNLLILLFIVIILTGCENIEEKQKNEYLNIKTSLLDAKKYSNKEDLPCDITVKIDRIDKENISYKIKLNNPKENMNNVKLVAVHNYYTESIFPTVGIFDDTKELKVGENNTIKLSSTIETTENINKINLIFKILIEYTDDSGNKKDIYYKTT